jgi:hypothetical protein
VGVLDLAAPVLDLGEQHVLLGIELVDALHRTDIDTRTILHIDASFSDDRNTRHGQLLICACMTEP